jgi:monoamine oxidase
MPNQVHIIGAGLAGLAAAMRLSKSGAQVVLHEAANRAGGRCRSYDDPALGIAIDNGNHLVLSGNRATMEFVSSIGAREELQGPGAASFPMVDLATNRRWTVRINDGRLPWWIFDASARVPGTTATQYLPLARLLWPPPPLPARCCARAWRPAAKRAIRSSPPMGSGAPSLIRR